MKKCGIITLYDDANHGNRLQNYALLNVLKNLGCKAVNCPPVKIGSLAKLNLAKTVCKILGKNKAYGLYNRYSRGRTFTFKYLKKDAIYNLDKNKQKKFDYFVCGSDQIWNPYWAGQPYYFANTAPAEKRISYAASFGVGEIPEQQKADYAKYLSEMKAISVREEAGTKIVKELTGREAEVLVDPTLMIDKEQWHKISKKPKYKTDDKFIFAYFLSDIGCEALSYIDYVQKETGYSVINLYDKHQNNYWYGTGPEEFIWLIENASVVITDSFHGSVFSVLMDTPFVVFRREETFCEMSSRLDTLLNILELQDRKFSNQQGDEIFKKDYSHIPNILKRERGKAIAFLKNAMELK